MAILSDSKRKVADMQEIDFKCLERLRTMAGLTKTAVAKTLGVSISHISEVERGKKGISLDLLERLVDLYGWGLEIRVLRKQTTDGAVTTYTLRRTEW